jgi:hypothetical protein
MTDNYFITICRSWMQQRDQNSPLDKGNKAACFRRRSLSSSSIISKSAPVYQQSLAVLILHPSTTHRRKALEQSGNNEYHNELLLQLENCKHRLCRRLRKKEIQQELNTEEAPADNGKSLREEDDDDDDRRSGDSSG